MISVSTSQHAHDCSCNTLKGLYEFEFHIFMLRPSAGQGGQTQRVASSGPVLRQPFHMHFQPDDLKLKMHNIRERTAGDPTRAFRGWTPGFRAWRTPVQQRPTAPNIVKMAEGGKRQTNLRLYNERPLRPTAHVQTSPICTAHALNVFLWHCVLYTAGFKSKWG